MPFLLRDTLLSIAASTVIAVGVVVVGVHVIGAPAPTAALGNGDTACLSEPLIPAIGTSVRGAARLCLGDDGAQPMLELESLASGGVYTAWLVYQDLPPTTKAGRCERIGTDADGLPITPGRVDGAVADMAGRARLTTLFRGMHVAGRTEVQLLVVDHGRLSPGGTQSSSRQLLSWHAAWLQQDLTADEVQHQGRIIGCVSFRLRGGVESIERD